MNRVLRVSVEDLDATVEAGVTHRQLNKALANTGVAFWVDPGADATIGGMAATRASGTTTVRYGTMREIVLGLTVVLADGRVIRTGGRARKSSAGYDLTRLFVGSEGTLGVITEVTVRLYGLPEAVSAAVCAFDSIEGAVHAVITTIQLGIPVARIELLDEVQIDAVNRYSQLSLRGEADAALRVSRHQRGRRRRARDGRAGDRRRARRQPSSGGRRPPRTARRCGRRATTRCYAALAMRPGGKAWVTDVCVPISALAECIVETKRDLAGVAGLRAARRPRRRRQLPSELRPRSRRSGAGGGGEGAERAPGRIVRSRWAAPAPASTASAWASIEYLLDEHGEAPSSVMRAIKRALDPAGMMNPGKIFCSEQVPSRLARPSSRALSSAS